jgi:fibronectin type 3 domain-containing protein
MIVFGVFALLVAWIGFQLGTHRHTGILRTLANAKHVLSEASTFASPQQRSASAPSGRRDSVTLSWKASTSAIVGYNVYRRRASGVVKLNFEPIPATRYVDRPVQPGQTYFYVAKAVSAKGAESTASNELRADVPSP